ncbi:DNA polymerase III subunit chi [Rhodobacteraceae bacterium RKSG542]|uniref:DNA polymerase III subunit chi n=1 Tax=Pseudovibrio flavus TaxID=2529854 RepID=UPI0012BB4A30|nr:DNA polymerase III subunit chi [Pseudovibrio flavus]MTI17603.1 DNA polymerase III subunit chi [Pseudovibrio flavus]
MSEVLFYQLSKFPLEQALPLLLQKCLDRDWAVTVQFGSQERRDSMNAHLWTYSDEAFLPHGTKEDGYEEAQPIYLTCEGDNPNTSIVRFCVDRAPLPDASEYQRVVYMFDGNDPEALQEARQRWVEVKGLDHELTYWAQTEQGGWERKA